LLFGSGKLSEPPESYDTQQAMCVCMPIAQLLLVAARHSTGRHGNRAHQHICAGSTHVVGSLFTPKCMCSILGCARCFEGTALLAHLPAVLLLFNGCWSFSCIQVIKVQHSSPWQPAHRGGESTGAGV
jgi:hypothetical protein